MNDGVDHMRGQKRTSRTTDEPGSATSHDEDPLTEYRRRKLELAELIRSVMSIAAERRDEEKRSRARELLARLAEDAFQLAVVGQFSRGKSTLMNAILGRAYLPTGALPMTSVVTTVRYGSKTRALVQLAGSTFPFERPLNELVRFVAQASLEREELRVASALVEVPAEILRLGFSFVDTPGVGSAIAANTATTESFLPQADAVIFVTSFDAPLSEAEVEFLTKVRRYVDKLFLVVNKLDLVSPAEAESVLRYVGERVDSDAMSASVRVFATSAKQALAAREHADDAQFAASGMAELEQALVDFLTTEKSRVFLQQVAARGQRLLARQRLDLELGRLAQSDDEAQRATRQTRFDERVDELYREVANASEELRTRVETGFAETLLDRSRTWPADLNRLLEGHLKEQPDRSSARSARQMLNDARAALLAAIDEPLENWFTQRTSEARALLIQFATRELDMLKRSEQSVERVSAEAFDLAAADGAQAEPVWTSSELPQLAVRAAAFDLEEPLPWWLVLVPATRFKDSHRRRHRTLVESSIAHYSAAVRETLLDAAARWAELVGHNVEMETHKAVERLHGRLRLPGSEEHLLLLDQIEQRLVVFAQELGTWEPRPAVEADRSGQALPVARPAPAAISPCVICSAIADVPFNYLADVQYELATRTASRQAHAANGGFCALHTWQYAETASDLGIAITYAEFAAEATRLLRAAEEEARSEEALRDAVLRLAPGSDRCPVCRAVLDAQRQAIVELVRGLPAESTDGAPPSLCLHHLIAVLDEPGLTCGKWLVAGLADVLGRAAEDMSTYALKRETLRKHLMNEEERASYLAVIAQLASRRELVRPWRNDADDAVL